MVMVIVPVAPGVGVVWGQRLAPVTGTAAVPVIAGVVEFVKGVALLGTVAEAEGEAVAPVTGTAADGEGDALDWVPDMACVMVGVTWLKLVVLSPNGLVACPFSLLLDAQAESMRVKAINMANMNFLIIYSSSIHHVKLGIVVPGKITKLFYLAILIEELKDLNSLIIEKK